MKIIKKAAGLVGLLCMSSLAGGVNADTVIGSEPVISIIIDDLGSVNPRHRQFVRLPGAITCSFLPLTKSTIGLAKLAHAYNKEIMLHLPMEAVAHNPLGPGGLSMNMSQQELVLSLQKSLASVPHVTGINNHMGSKMTRHPEHMVWLMKEIKRSGELFFVDSRTTPGSVAMRVAHQHGVPGLQRDVFLDHDPDLESVRRQFDKTIRLAKRKGTAVAIGHPYQNTLVVLKEKLPQLQQLGVHLIPISEMIKYRSNRRQTWQASLSRSQKGVKSLKP